MSGVREFAILVAIAFGFATLMHMIAHQEKCQIEETRQ
jgi:hypothetical protein